jgi:hypothetical protein
MRLSEIIRSLRPATFAEKTLARVAGVSGGIDVSLPYLQSGWVNVADSQYTVGSPLTITAGTRTRLTINGNGAATNRAFANGMPSDVWSDDKFKPSDIGECYNLRLTCTVTQTTSGTGTYATFEADIGTDGSPFIAATESVSLLKGQGVATQMTISAPFFTLDTFGRNGAKLYLTPSVDITAWGFALFIQRTFKP